MKSYRSLLALAAGAALTMTAAPAFAQAAASPDEVSALRAQVQQLLTRIEKLEKAPTSAPAAAGSATVAKPASQDVPLVAASAFKAPQITQSGNSKVKLTLSGQVGRAVILADDGVDTDAAHVDNSGSSTRIRFTGAAALDDNWTAGTDIELEAASAASRTTGLRTDSGTFSFNERKMEFWVQHKQLGRVWVGQGDTATNVIAEIDLSGTGTLLGYSDVGATFGGIAFRNKRTDAISTTTINSAFNNLDGLNRDDRVRYDSPTFAGGFVVSGSVLEGGATDAALRYNGKIGDTEVAAGVGYADNDSRTGFDSQTSGSFSVRFANGFNVTAAGGTRDLGTADTEYYYGKLGYIAKLTSVGATAFAVDYYRQNDTTGVSSRAKAYGASVVQTVDAFAADFYIGVRNHEYNTVTADYQDVFGVITGARVRF